MGHPTYHVNVMKVKRKLIWAGGLPHLSGLPHLPGLPNLHVNRPFNSKGTDPGVQIVAKGKGAKIDEGKNGGKTGPKRGGNITSTRMLTGGVVIDQ